MANEIQFGFTSGKTLTYGAYQPDGTVRTAAGTSLPENGSTGQYFASDANVVVGDAIIVRDTVKVVGWGPYEIPAEAMRGTDSAALASVCTEGRLAELDAANLPADVDTIAVDVAGLDGAAMRGTDSAALASVCTEGRLAELDAANLPADIDAIVVKTDPLPADPASDTNVDAAETAVLDHLNNVTDVGIADNGVKIDALNDFDPANDAVANVALVDVTTENTDMVGTDDAALASVCTEARLAELDAANLPAVVDAVLVDTDFLQKVTEGDMTTDTGPIPWQVVVKEKSTANELLRKDLKTPAGVDITSAASIVGQTVEP